jgi:uncharacterized protein HemX
MTKYLLIALAVLALVAGAFGYVEYVRADAATVKATQAAEHAQLAEKALTEANRQNALLRSTSLARQQQINALRTQAEAQQKALDAALQANPDWAHAPVPQRVWDALLPAPAAAGQAGPGVDGADAKAAAAGPR